MAGTWTIGKSMPTARQDHRATYYDGKIYCIGGTTGDRDPGAATRNVDIYDIASNTWSSGRPCPYDLIRHGQPAAYNGKIYCIGGYTQNADKTNTLTTRVNIYDILSNTWSTGTPIPTARYHFCCALVGHKIYCVGGQTHNEPAKTTEVYDILQNSWSTNSVIYSSSYITGTAIGDNVYLSNVSLLMHNVNTDNIDRIPNVIVNPYNSISSVGDKLYCSGGYQSTARDNLYVYDTQKDTLYEETPMLWPRARHATCSDGKRLYCIGGNESWYNGETLPSNALEIFTSGHVIHEYFHNIEGEELSPNTTTLLSPGDSYYKTSPRIPGYKRIGQRVDSSPDQTTRTATIENVQQDHTVTFLYEPCDGEYCQDILITESYYDVTNDTYIRPDTYEYLAQGDDYRKLAPAIPGYKRVGHRIDDGPDMPGITDKLLDVTDDHHIHFLYEPGDEEPGLDVPIIEKYFDLEPNTYIRPDTATYVELGGTYRKTAPAIAGYERVGYRVDAGPSSSSLTAVITDVRETHVVTFLYEPDDESGTISPGEAVIITERYFDVENQAFIQSDTYTRVRKGADYEKTAPAITGYDRVGHQIDRGTVQTSLTAQIMDVQESHVVTFLYEPDEGGGVDPGDKIVITEEYYDMVGRTYIQPDTQTRVDRGADYQKIAPSLPGYHRLGHQVDGGAAQGSFTARIDNVQETHTVTFLYQPDDGGGSTEPPEDGILIIERYYDIVGRKYLLSDTYTKVARGATYQKTAPAISGYFRVGHRIDNGAKSTNQTAIIENVRDDHTVTFLYKPDDDGGKDPGPGPGDGNGCCCCCKCMPAMPMMMCVPVIPMMCMPWSNGCGCCSCGKSKGCLGKKPQEDSEDDCR